VHSNTLPTARRSWVRAAGKTQKNQPSEDRTQLTNPCNACLSVPLPDIRIPRYSKRNPNTRERSINEK
jgi:hypothetical protein